MKVTSSVTAKIACSSSLKKEVSRQALTRYNRCSDSPSARASFVCMSRQYEQPFSCDALTLIRFLCAFVKLILLRYFSKLNMMLYASGSSCLMSNRLLIVVCFLLEQSNKHGP